MLGKREAAIAAFRAASVLDASFEVPKEAGSRGSDYARQAKQDTEDIGSLQLSLVVPEHVGAGAPFKVTAYLDEAHLSVVSQITLTATESVEERSAFSAAPPSETITLDVPTGFAPAGSTLTLRVDALDPNRNRLASTQARVFVPGHANTLGSELVVDPSTTESPSNAPRDDASTRSDAAPYPDHSAGDTARRSSSFFGSTWFYILGGAILAGAGVAAYVALRPAAPVEVGPVGVQVRQRN